MLILERKQRISDYYGDSKNFYNYVVEKVSRVFNDIQPTTRLKRFIFRFITVAGKWIYSGRQWVLKLYTDRPYDLLFT